MRLYLMRHGKAGAAARDEERPLSDRGRADVRDVAAYLSGTGLSVSHVIHSSLLRAKQTAEIMADVLKPETAPMQCQGLEPWGDVKAFAAMAGAWTEDTLVCGHEPFMGEAAKALLGDADSYIAVHTATVMAFERYSADQDWKMMWLVNPDIVKQSGS